MILSFTLINQVLWFTIWEMSYLNCVYKYGVIEEELRETTSRD